MTHSFDRITWGTAQSEKFYRININKNAQIRI